MTAGIRHGRAVWGAAVAVALAAAPALAAKPTASFSRIRARMIAETAPEIMRKSASSVEIVTFPNRHAASVKVLRGISPRTPAAVAAPPAAIAVPAPGKKPNTVEVVAFANPNFRPVTVIRGPPGDEPDIELFAAAREADLDLVAFAVDGAESSHGADLRMWRPDDWRGPQGPMQVSEAAALDVGGGDRFDFVQNRLLGRAYLAHLYRRYGNWADAVAAYNWGPGNIDSWIAAGRSPEALPLEVERYRNRVLREVERRHELDAVLRPALRRLGAAAGL